MTEPMKNVTNLSSLIESAMRWAAMYHRYQTRKGSDLPYVQHPMAVGMTLQGLGWEESVVAAGFLHDLVEDTEVTLEMIRSEFGERIAQLVDDASERKEDAQGLKIPWETRKDEHLARLQSASVESRAVVLADRLHNLFSIKFDLEHGLHDWSKFNATRDRLLAYYQRTFDRLSRDDARLQLFAKSGLELLDAIRSDDIDS